MDLEVSRSTKITAHTPIEDERLYQLGLTMVPGIGDVLIKQLMSYCGSAQAIFKSKKAKLLKIPGIGEKIASEIIKKAPLIQAEHELGLINKYGISLLFYTDPAFPQKLKQIADAPILLYFKGKANLNTDRVLSVVGTRNATEYGRSFTYQFIEEIKKVSPLIVSGLAYGIDIHVHKACLENGIPTVGVMGSGINVIYPSLHKNIAADMIKNGGIMTEFPFGTKPDKQNFPARNRIVAGMADATLIVEAAKEGGALITAEIANSYNKDVFSVPGPVNAKYSEGCNNLIKQNKAQMITCAQDLIEAMNWDKEVPVKMLRKDAASEAELEGDEKIIIEVLRQNIEIQIDELAWKAQLPINKVASLLLTLEFKGLVKASPGKKFKLKQ